MAIITPSVVPNASLSMPLITPGYPLVAVEKANPAENSQGKLESVDPATKRANAIHNAGHDGDRSL